MRRGCMHEVPPRGDQVRLLIAPRHSGKTQRLDIPIMHGSDDDIAARIPVP